MVRKKTNIQKESFFQAGQELLQKVRKSETVCDADVRASWKRLEVRLDRERTRKLRIRYGWSAVAASVALLLAVGVGFWVTERDDSAVSLSLLDKEVPALNENEVVLIAQNDRMQLKDESSVVYGEDGQADLKEQVVKKVSEPETKKEEETKINQIVVPKGRKVDITFSDGTKMYVNAGSRVIYPALFAKDKREIVVEGEVYLDVRKDPSRPFIVKTKEFEVKVLGIQKDPSRPFIVKTKEFEVKVLGTQFNVCAYEEDSEASVVLVEGKVEVQTETGNGKTTLAPNQLIAVSEGGTSVKEVDVFEYICWKDNMMLLNNRTVGEVIERLSRHYGRSIVCEADVENIPISGKLDLREETEDVVNILCQSLYLAYHIDENNRIVLTKK